MNSPDDYPRLGWVWRFKHQNLPALEAKATTYKFD
jgi:hypothetical protein